MASPLLAGSIEGQEADALAVEMAYRLDRQLGAVQAAHHHLLVWRLLSALERGELGPGSAVADRWTEWQNQLQLLQVRSRLQRLAAWFQPLQTGTVQTLLASAVPSQTNTVLDHWWLASSAVRLVTEGDAPEVAAAVYPQQLAWARSHAPGIWARLLTLLADNPEFQPLVAPLLSEWLALPLQAPLQQWRQLTDTAAGELAAFRQKPKAPLDLLSAEVDYLLEVMEPGSANDPLRLTSLPYHQATRNTIVDQLDQAVLALTRAVHGMRDGDYVALVQVLLATAQLAIEHPHLLEGRRRVQALLAQLERIDPAILPQFDYVDARLLTVYQQVRKLLRDWSEGQANEALLRRIAELHAVIGGDAPDLAGYLEQPFRAAARQLQTICLNISGEDSAYPPQPIALQEFEQCLQGLSEWALRGAARAEMAGDFNGPFEAEHVARELELSPWQRVNYWFGYGSARLASQCPERSQPLVNPFEWALAAHTVLWLAERWPAYFAGRSRSQWLDRWQAAGRALLVTQTQALACRDQSGLGPFQRVLDDYAGALTAVIEALNQATQAYRARRLAPGADVRLAEGAAQATSYRPENLMVLPCDDRAWCEMADPLPVSRALLGLFPPPLLIADQIRLGQISLCYRQVQWVDRRAVAPSVRNAAMAKYYGRLSFQLVGRYSGMQQPVFVTELTGRSEYEYLYGANTQEVLDDPCSRQRINTQVQAELPRRAIELVPRRLTYLTADRMSPTRVFQQNWNQGEEWQDWFVTGKDVVVKADQGPEAVIDSLEARLQDLYQDWNRHIYSALAGQAANQPETIALAAAMDDLDRHKGLLLALARVQLPGHLARQASLRASLLGREGLFSRTGALQMQRQNVAVDAIGPLARSRFDAASRVWRVEQVDVYRASASMPMVAFALLKLEALRLRYER